MAYSRGGYSSNNKYDKSYASCQRRKTPKIPMRTQMTSRVHTLLWKLEINTLLSSRVTSPNGARRFQPKTN